MSTNRYSEGDRKLETKTLTVGGSFFAFAVWHLHKKKISCVAGGREAP